MRNKISSDPLEQKLNSRKNTAVFLLLENKRRNLNVYSKPN